MTKETRHLLKVISLLLQFPDEELLLSLKELSEAVEEISDPKRREKCRKFLHYLSKTSPIRLQEVYTATFDLSPPTCLNLSYHRWGDHKERGNALARFQEIYNRDGYEALPGELPDYLPLVLEFLAVGGKAHHFSLFGEYAEQVETICSRLQENGSPYADLLEIAAGVFEGLRGGVVKSYSQIDSYGLNS